MRRETSALEAISLKWSGFARKGLKRCANVFEAFRRACEAIARVDVPVVAAVEGVAMAGGFELMQACDIVLVSEDARIADNHIKFG